MKIGQVAKNFEISIDKIRYYINLGLIVPDKKHTQYVFNNKDLDDLQMILMLKKLNFSLREIHQIVSIRRVSNLVDEKDIIDLIQLYKNKKQQLTNKKKDIEHTIKEIDKEIKTLSKSKATTYEKTGVPLIALEYLYCPNCQIPLQYKNIEMNHKYIFSGDLFCSCGYRAKIDKGIVMTNNRNTSLYDQPDLEREFYMDIPPTLISLFQKSYNWMLDQFDISHLTNKIILETHINAYFFMHKHIMEMDKDGLYIIIDKFPEMIAMYKQRIDYLNLGFNILYIADNSIQYPIKKGSIDLFIDYFSTNEHCFYNNTYLSSDIRDYFNNNASIIGTYFYFDSFSKSIKNLCAKYPEASINNFNLEYFKNALDATNIDMINYKNIGFVTNTGDNRAFSFHQDGEKMHMYSYLAKPMAEKGL